MGKRIRALVSIVLLLATGVISIRADQAGEGSLSWPKNLRVSARFISDSTATSASRAESGHPDASMPVVTSVVATATTMTRVDFVPKSQAISVGELTTLAVQVSEVRNLYGAQVHIRFDPDLLAVVDANQATPGIQISPGQFLNGYPVRNEVNNVTGDIHYAVSLLRPALPVTGTGTLATITFEGMGLGIARIAFGAVYLSEPSATPIEHITGADAEIQIMAALSHAYLPLALKSFAP